MNKFFFTWYVSPLKCLFGARVCGDRPLIIDRFNYFEGDILIKLTSQKLSDLFL